MVLPTCHNRPVRRLRALRTPEASMNRLLNFLRGLFHRTMDRVEDPEMMLEQARRDMNQALLSNKERAVQAMTQRNRLAGMLKEQQEKSVKLEGQAAMALKQGNRDLATQLMREKMNVDASIATLQQSYEQANATVDQVKIAVKRQEEEVRRKTAEALTLKTQYKSAQIQSSINKALDGLSFDDQFGATAFGAASERIKEKMSEAEARQEMYAGSIHGKLAGLQDAQMDMEAASELERLEERLGMKPAAVTEPAVQTQTVGGSASAEEATRALEELEARLKNNGPG